MHNIRIILFFALAFVLLLIYQAWVRDYGPVFPQPQVTNSSSQPANKAAAPVAEGQPAQHPAELPPPPSTGKTAQSAVPHPVAGAGPVFGSNSRIRVRTDVLQVEIDTLGGDIRKVELLDYPVSTEKDAPPFLLMNDQLPDLFVAQSGLYSADQQAPNHETQYASEISEYQLADGVEILKVPLSWKGPNGLQVEKSYTFHRGSYVIDQHYRVDNQAGTPWTGREYRQLQRSPGSGKNTQRFVGRTYIGAAIYSPEDKYQKISFDDMKEANLSRDITGGWAAMLQHYFLGAWIPDPEETDNYFSRVLPQSRYAIGMYGPPVAVPAGGSHEFSSRLYAGPTLQDQLADVAPGLELTVDYGWLTVLSQPLFWLLEKLHGLFGNWGWAIIMLTVLIKLAFFKLSETSYKSMAKMRNVAPRLQALKDRYGDDKQRLNQAMMEMYKKEKINPLGGCLPIVVQIPVFIALYWVLLQSVELRQAPFILWINNLSSPDPYYILPLLMGVSMFIQQKLNPAPMDPMQAKIMMSLPFVFTVFFAFFPAGLVLYWVVNNVLSISQQWYITRQISQQAH